MERRHAGFTLIELLAAVAIIAVLVSLIIPAVASVRKTGERNRAALNMRQIGAAIFQYANDNEGRIPGPMQPAQKILYIPNSIGVLGTALGPYLGVYNAAVPQAIKAFLPPACLRALPKVPRTELRPYVLNITAPSEDGVIYPWGNPANPVAPPMKIAALKADTWAIADADQKNPLVTGQPWARYTPPSIIHGRLRLALFFNGSVQPIETATLALSASPRSSSK